MKTYIFILSLFISACGSDTPLIQSTHTSPNPKPTQTPQPSPAPTQIPFPNAEMRCKNENQFWSQNDYGCFSHQINKTVSTPKLITTYSLPGLVYAATPQGGYINVICENSLESQTVYNTWKLPTIYDIYALYMTDNGSLGIDWSKRTAYQEANQFGRIPNAYFADIIERTIRGAGNEIMIHANEQIQVICVKE